MFSRTLRLTNHTIKRGVRKCTSAEELALQRLGWCELVGRRVRACVHTGARAARLSLAEAR